MKPDRTALLGALDPAVVQENLRTRGWRLVEPRAAGQRYAVYEREGIAVDVPLHQSDRDYARRIEELSTTVAAVERVSTDELLDALGQPGFVPLSNVEVTGLVVRLERNGRAGDAPGEIDVVPTEQLPVQVPRVRVALGPADYAEALQAHAVGARVRISGTLARQGRRWVLSAARGLTRCSPDPSV